MVAPIISRATITAIREMDPSIIIEVLVPDFHAQDWCIQIVLDAGPDIYNHNMETVERLTPLVRSRAKYRTSLQVLDRAKKLSPSIVTKSGVMLGLGEKETGTFPDDGRFARGRVRGPDDGPVSPPECRSICPSSNTSRPSNSITTATSRVEKGFITSPPVRWFAARITRPISIRSCAGRGSIGRGEAMSEVSAPAALLILVIPSEVEESLDRF